MSRAVEAARRARCKMKSEKLEDWGEPQRVLEAKNFIRYGRWFGDREP